MTMPEPTVSSAQSRQDVRRATGASRLVTRLGAMAAAVLVCAACSIFSSDLPTDPPRVVTAQTASPDRQSTPTAVDSQPGAPSQSHEESVTYPPEGGEVTFPSYAVPRWIPMPQSRLDEMRAYARARYGIDSYHLEPSMVVLHFTDSSAQAAINHFSQDIPQSGWLPGVCAHYVVDQDGTIYQLVPTNIMCRHAVGVNHEAIGIEVAQQTFGNSAQWADRQILDRAPQMAALLELVADLQRRFAIPTDRIAGHATVNSDPAFRDSTGMVNDHGDWQEADVLEFRRRLDAFVSERDRPDPRGLTR